MVEFGADLACATRTVLKHMRGLAVYPVPGAPDRLPRIDYMVGGGGALVESMVYRTSAPLAYVPMYGSGQNPAGASRNILGLGAA